DEAAARLAPVSAPQGPRRASRTPVAGEAPGASARARPGSSGRQGARRRRSCPRARGPSMMILRRKLANKRAKIFCLTPGTPVILLGACISTRSGPQQQQASDPLTHFIVVREDLETGIASAQIAHAAGESSPGDIPEGTYAIVLAVPDEASLERL